MRETSLAQKLASCLTAAFTSIALLLVLGNSGTIDWLLPTLVFSLCGICLIAGLIYPFIWQLGELPATFD